MISSNTKMQTQLNTVQDKWLPYVEPLSEFSGSVVLLEMMSKGRMKNIAISRQYLGNQFV